MGLLGENRPSAILFAGAILIATTIQYANLTYKPRQHFFFGFCCKNWMFLINDYKKN
jgi:hypothetical protein